jgi:hypothetical protein
VTGLPKGGRERTVDLPGSAVDALKGYRHLRGPYVFCQEDGQPLTAGMTEHQASQVVPDGKRTRRGPGKSQLALATGFSTTMSARVLPTMAKSSACSASGTLYSSSTALKMPANATHSDGEMFRCLWDSAIVLPV